MLSVSLSRLVVDCTVLFLEGSATIRANFEFQDCYLQHSRILPLCFGSLRFLLLSLDTVIGRQYDLLLNYCIKTEHLHEHDCFRLALVDQHQTAPIERSATIEQFHFKVAFLPGFQSKLSTCLAVFQHRQQFLFFINNRHQRNLRPHGCFRLALVDQHQIAPIERSAAIDQTRVLPVPLCSSTLCVSCCVQHSHTDRFVMHLQIHMYLYMYLPEIACD